MQNEHEIINVFYKKDDVVIHKDLGHIYRVANGEKFTCIKLYDNIRKVILGYDYIEFCLKSSFELLTFDYIEKEIELLNEANNHFFEMGQKIIDYNITKEDEFQIGNVIVGNQSRNIYQIESILDKSFGDDLAVVVLYNYRYPMKNYNKFWDVSSSMCSKMTLNDVDRQIETNNKKINFLFSLMEKIINEQLYIKG